MNSVEAMNSDVCELGQYYTDKKIVTYMCKKISIKDNEVVSLCDPFGGSGGFLSMNNDKNKNKNENETTTNSN